MADFYIKYGSNNAKLIFNFKLGKTTIKIHDVGPRYTISKNRKIIAEYIVLQDALEHVAKLVLIECSGFINL